MISDDPISTRLSAKFDRFGFGFAIVGALALTSGGAIAQDSDADGVLDAADTFPCNPGAVAGAWAPARGAHGVVMFEDQWPTLGDFDFNDVVVGYRYEARLDASGKATSLLATFNVHALGGDLHNGLGLHLPVARGAVGTVRRRVDGGAFSDLPSALDAELTVEVSTNLRELFGATQGPINSRIDRMRQVGSILEVEVQFLAPILLDLGASPFDIFIFRTQDPTHQVHLPEFSGSAIVDASRFGTRADASGGGRYYLDARGVPFALHVPQTAQTDDGSMIVYPQEATDISSLFTRLVLFATSGGVDGSDYYLAGLDNTKGFRDAQGLASPAPRLPSVAPACTLLAPVPVPVAFAPVVNATPGRFYASNVVPLDAFVGAVDVSVTNSAFAIVESHDLTACLTDTVFGRRLNRVLADPSSHIANLGYTSDVAFVAGECPNRIVSAQTVTRIAGESLQLIVSAGAFDTTDTTQVQTLFGDMFGTWTVTAPADLSDFYVSEGGVGDCSALLPCDLSAAIQHAGFGIGDALVLVSDVTAASISLRFPLSIRSQGPRKKLIVTGSFQVGDGVLGPTTFTNVELEQSSSVNFYGTTVTLTDSIFRSATGSQWMTVSAGTSNQTTRYGIDIQNCELIAGQVSLNGINDLTLLGNTFTDATMRIVEASNTLAGRAVLTIRNNDFGGYVDTTRNTNYAVWTYLYRDADITFENNVLDATGYFGAMRFHMWRGAASFFIHNNTLIGDSYGLVVGTQAPPSSGTTQFACIEMAGNQVSHYVSFTASGNDPTISEMQVEQFSEATSLNQIGQLVNGNITDVAPGTCAARL